MAAEGRPLYFTAVFFYFVNTDERPAMGSQPNLASRSKLMSFYKFRRGPSLKIWGSKDINFGPLFPRLPHSTPHIFGTKRSMDKQNASVNLQCVPYKVTYNVSPTRWPTFRDFWPRNGWDPFSYFDATFGGHYVATIKVAIFLVLFVCTYTDFSSEDKASGVKFCRAVHCRPRQGISHFEGTLLPQNY